MSLELGPETERRVREYAAAEGISIEELMDRAFPPRVCEETHTLLAQRYAETDNLCLKHKAFSTLFSEEEARSARITAEEYVTELKFWEDYDRECSSCHL